MPLRTVELFIDGQWRGASSGETLDVLDPATEAVIARVVVADEESIARALSSVADGFGRWRCSSAVRRQAVLRKAAEILRQRTELVAGLITDETGKPLAEAQTEVARCIDIFEWYADEARRSYGRIVPAQIPGLSQSVRYEPIGPVAAFSPWNFPASQAAKKLAAALAAGCSIVLKGPEEAPSGCAELVRALDEAGLETGAVALVFGRPAMIADRLICSDVTRKVSFTGSVPVGRQLAALAASQLKPCTLELGGHAPVIVCADVDPVALAPQLASLKFRNAGQVCVSPSRFFVHRDVHNRFAEAFVASASASVPMDGRAKGARLGPLSNSRRVQAMKDFVADAVGRGAKLECGGHAVGERGFFFAPTVLTGVPDDARVMREEIFGPVVPIASFATLEEAMVRSNSTAYGLAAYAFTSSAGQAEKIAAGLECGVISINHLAGSVAEMPLGGRRDSGYGSEGGPEGLQAYLVPKSIAYRPQDD